MNIETLHAHVTHEFDQIHPILSPVFDVARRRAATGRQTNVAPWVHTLSDVLKPHRVRISTYTQKDYRASHPSIQWYPPIGGYCYESPTKLPKIEIILNVHKSSHRLELTSQGWYFFEYRFYKTLLHELVHRVQFTYNNRDRSSLLFRPHPHAQFDKYQFLEQKYLGEMMEIEAYARDCAEEWHYSYPTTRMTPTKLQKDFYGPRNLPVLNYYYNAFQGDATHPAVQRLFRKIHTWNNVLTPLTEYLPDCPFSAPSNLKRKGREFALA